MSRWVYQCGWIQEKGVGMRAVGRDEGLLESPLPRTSTDQQGLYQGGCPGGGGRVCFLPIPPNPCLPAGGPRGGAEPVQVHGCPGDPGRCSSLQRAALFAPVTPIVNQGAAPPHIGAKRRCWVDGRRHQQPAPSWLLHELNLQILSQQNE